MLFSIAVTLLVLSFFASIVLTGFFRNVARANNILIDIPNKSRKFHFRPTPLIGGVSIHTAMLLSSVLMLFLIDFKYDFQFNGFDIPNESKQELLSDVSYSKQLKIIDPEGQSIESYRVNIAPQNNTGLKTPLYDVSIGSNENDSLKIIQIGDNKFTVFQANGQVNTFQSTPSGIVEINSSGQPLSQPINIGKTSENYFAFSSFTAAFIIISIFLQAFTLIDDAFGLRPWKRLCAQSLATLGLIIAGDIFIESLAISAMSISLELGYFGIPFTIFAVVGIINAFNMIDGINGLCAGFSLVALGALQIASGFNVANYSLVIAMGSIIGFLFYNLGFLGTKRRVFLGDNGSTFLGFLVAWTCINYSQSETNLIQPVTCLWIVAVPLWDCLGVMIGRTIKGILPFSPGRDHIHHKLQEITKSSSKTLFVLLGTGIMLATIGIFIEKSDLTSEMSLMLFAMVSMAYYFTSSKLAKLNLSNT